eukprot:Platyproteum_vivax@DN3641_c0_g1_i2.p2
MGGLYSSDGLMRDIDTSLMCECTDEELQGLEVFVDCWIELPSDKDLQSGSGDLVAELMVALLFDDGVLFDGGVSFVVCESEEKTVSGFGAEEEIHHLDFLE